MIVESRVFDGTIDCWYALIEWAGYRFTFHISDDDDTARVKVMNHDADMIQWAEPGDTIERHDDGLLVVMPAGIAERTVRAKM